MVLVWGGAGRVGDGSSGTSWAVTHSGGNAWRSASSICWPRGASVSVAAARGWTARWDPRGAFVVPASVVFVFGARRRCGTAAIRAPSIDADSIVAIYRSSCRCRHSVCADTAGAPVYGSSSHVQIYLDIRKLPSPKKVPIPIFFFGGKTKESKTRATGGWMHQLE